MSSAMRVFGLPPCRSSATRPRSRRASGARFVLFGAALPTALGLALTACGGSPPADLPEIPNLVETPESAAARERLDAALRRVRSEPGDAAANARLGMLRHAEGLVEHAAILYRRARLLDPRNFDWNYFEGVALIELERCAEALDPLKTAVRLSSGERSHFARLRLAQARLCAAGEADEELRAQAEADLAGLALDSPQLAEARFELGRLALDSGDLAGALKHLRKTIELGGDFEKPHRLLAEVYSRLGDERLAARARVLAERRRGSRVSFPAPLRDRIYALATTDDPAERAEDWLRAGMLRHAGAELLRAIADNPADAQSHARLIAVNGLLGRFPQAEERFLEAIRLDPGAPEPYLNMGTIRLTQGEWSAARKLFERAVEADPMLMKAHIGLARALRALGARDQAIADLRRAAAADPYDAAVRAELADLLISRGEADAALRRLDEALLYAEDRESAPLLRKRADLLAAVGKSGEAERSLEQALVISLSVGNQVDAVLIEGRLRRLREVGR